MAKSFWCKLGFHKYGRSTFITNVNSNVRDWSKKCILCGKRVTWVEAKQNREY